MYSKRIWGRGREEADTSCINTAVSHSHLRSLMATMWNMVDTFLFQYLVQCQRLCRALHCNHNCYSSILKTNQFRKWKILMHEVKHQQYNQITCRSSPYVLHSRKALPSFEIQQKKLKSISFFSLDQVHWNSWNSMKWQVCYHDGFIDVMCMMLVETWAIGALSSFSADICSIRTRSFDVISKMLMLYSRNTAHDVWIQLMMYEYSSWCVQQNNLSNH